MPVHRDGLEDWRRDPRLEIAWRLAAYFFAPALPWARYLGVAPA